MRSKVWDEITYPFPNFNRATENVMVILNSLRFYGSVNVVIFWTVLMSLPVARKIMISQLVVWLIQTSSWCTYLSMPLSPCGLGLGSSLVGPCASTKFMARYEVRDLDPSYSMTGVEAISFYPAFNNTHDHIHIFSKQSSTQNNVSLKLDFYIRRFFLLSECSCKMAYRCL